MSKIENAVKYAIKIANDNSHGYDQGHRWGNPDYDCSALVITACEQAGIPLKTKGATYTGNIREAALKCGFKDVTSKVNFKTGAGLKRGDILLLPGEHVAFYCGNGKMVDARINEKGKTTGGKHGDQTGREIMVHAYSNHPWSVCLRYAVKATDVTSTKVAPAKKKTVKKSEIVEKYQKAYNKDVDPNIGVDGIKGNETTKSFEKVIIKYEKGKAFDKHKNLVKLIQEIMGFKDDDVDGLYGSATVKKVKAYQKSKGLTDDGIVGPKTWNKMIK